MATGCLPPGGLWPGQRINVLRGRFGKGERKRMEGVYSAYKCMHACKNRWRSVWLGGEEHESEGKARGFDVYLYPFGEGMKKEKEQLQLRLVRDELVREQ